MKFARMNPEMIEKYVTGTHPTVKARQRIEIEIAHALLVVLIRAGFSVRVVQGDDASGDTLPIRTTVDEAMGDLFQCDDDRILVYRADSAKRFGWVYLVYGNDGWDVISDYTTNLEAVIEIGEVKRLQELYG